MGVIYIRTNLINGMQYVGKAKNIIARNCNWNCLKYKYGNQFLTDERNKYGLENFKTDIIKECDDEDLDKWEKHYIALYDTIYPNGYNDNEGGSIGFHHSERTKRAISKANTGKEAWNKGKTYEELFDEETANKLRKTTSDFAKTRVGELNPFYGHHFEVHPMQGKHHKVESKRKIGDANRNGRTSIPIVFIKDDTYEVIEFPSERQAVREGYSTGNLSRAVNGNYKGGHHYRGGNWYKKSDYEKRLEN